jgi:hypothetical protein
MVYVPASDAAIKDEVIEKVKINKRNILIILFNFNL